MFEMCSQTQLRGDSKSMKLILSHASALDFIRTSRWRRDRLRRSKVQSLADCAHSLSEIEQIRIPAFDQTTRQLEVLVGDVSKAQRSKDHICRVLKTPPIRGMFCEIDEGAYITSPEMTFVQMATRLSEIDLILLGMEFCGTYAPCPYGNRYDERPPVSTKEKLLNFCERAKGMRGTVTASKALRWVVDGSNSPAESALVLYLCLPVRRGGYGFKYPDMNPTTPLGKRASRMFGHPTMRCDLHWVDERVALEYDSDQEHLTSHSASTDALRRNVLGYKDVTVITVRKPMIVSPKAFDDVARQLAKALNQRLRPRNLEFTRARSDLRLELFPWLTTDWW